MKLSRVCLAGFALIAVACQREKRDLDPQPPVTAPNGPSDPRASNWENNAFQLSQGGRLFGWYGCSGCHGESARGVLDLADDRWRYGGDIASVYASIAQGRPGGMPAYQTRIPPEQIWQLSAFARNLHKLSPAMRRRQDLDQAGEPQGSSWSGAVR